MDLLQYLKGDGRIYSVHYDWDGGGNQVMQTQLSDGYFNQLKWEQWEQLFADGQHIFRTVDTSPGHNEVYELRDVGRDIGSAWIKREMVVGQIFERNPRILWYDKTTGALKKEDRFKTWIQFDKHHPSWKTPAGFTVQDVIELGWYLDEACTLKAETYWYAKGYGLVGWQGGLGRSYIESVFPSHPPLTREPLRWWNPPADPLAGNTAPPVTTPATEPKNNEGIWFLRPTGFRYVITSSFGKREAPPPLMHEGVDYAPAPGTPGPFLVLAPQDGVVSKVGDSGDGGYGRYIRIDHTINGELWQSWLGHLDKQLVKEGDVVKAGQVVGHAGATGNVTALHLHWTLANEKRGEDGYPIRKAVNPVNYVVSKIPNATPQPPAPAPTPAPDPVVSPQVRAAVLAQVGNIERVQTELQAEHLRLGEIREALLGSIGQQ